MTKFLLKLFVKDHKDTANPTVRASIGKLAGMTGVVCNFLLALGKLVLGTVLGSVSITADGVNNLSDSASSVITFLGFRMAQSPADKEHPYGHARYEYLSGLTVAVLILLVGVELVKTSVGKILNPAASEIGLVTMGILVVSALVKWWMSGFYQSLGKQVNSMTLLAAATDSRNDILITGAVLVNCVVEYFFQIRIDGYVGLAVALFIL